MLPTDRRMVYTDLARGISTNNTRWFQRPGGLTQVLDMILKYEFVVHRASRLPKDENGEGIEKTSAAPHRSPKAPAILNSEMHHVGLLIASGV